MRVVSGKSTERMREDGPDGVETLSRAGADVPAAPVACRRTLVERARWQWRPADGGDPAALAQEFLAAHGLPLHDL
ncbi:anthranilate synthase component I family protein, partial [Micromonospora sp. NPDC052213]